MRGSPRVKRAAKREPRPPRRSGRDGKLDDLDTAGCMSREGVADASQEKPGKTAPALRPGDDEIGLPFADRVEQAMLDIPLTQVVARLEVAAGLQPVQG